MFFHFSQKEQIVFPVEKNLLRIVPSVVNMIEMTCFEIHVLKFKNNQKMESLLSYHPNFKSGDDRNPFF